MKNKRQISGVDSHAQKETALTPKSKSRQQNARPNDTPPAVSGQCAEVHLPGAGDLDWLGA